MVCKHPCCLCCYPYPSPSPAYLPPAYPIFFVRLYPSMGNGLSCSPPQRVSRLRRLRRCVYFAPVLLLVLPSLDMLELESFSYRVRWMYVHIKSGQAGRACASRLGDRACFHQSIRLCAWSPHSLNYAKGHCCYFFVLREYAAVRRLQYYVLTGLAGWWILILNSDQRWWFSLCFYLHFVWARL